MEKEAKLKFSRNKGHSANFVGSDRIFVAGGRKSMKTCEIYSIEEDKWEQMADLC